MGLYDSNPTTDLMRPGVQGPPRPQIGRPGLAPVKPAVYRGTPAAPTTPFVGTPATAPPAPPAGLPPGHIQGAMAPVSAQTQPVGMPSRGAFLGGKTVQPPSVQIGVPQQAAQPHPAGPSGQFFQAQSALINKQADAAIANGTHVNDQASYDANHAALNDLFKQHHGGMAPGEFQADQRARMAMAPGYDPFRQNLADKAANPGYQIQGGTAAYQGNGSDGGFGLSIGERNRNLAGSAAAQVADYDFTRAKELASNPYTQIGVAKGFAGDRSALGAAIGVNRGDPSQANNIPVQTEGGHEVAVTPQQELYGGTGQAVENGGGPMGHSTPNPVNTGNFLELLNQSPGTKGLAEKIEGGEPFGEVAQHFASSPAAADPNSLERRSFDAYFNHRMNDEGQAFQNELAQYGPGGQPAAALHQGGLSLIDRMLGINPKWTLPNLVRSAFGRNQAQDFSNQRTQEAMQRLGYGAAQTKPTWIPQIGAVGK